jgi:4-hydroxybenzoate polyprenyltransferase
VRGPVVGARPRGNPPWGLFRAAHPFPSLLVALATLGVAFAADSSPRPLVAAQLGLGMLFFQFAIGLANDAVDHNLDAAAKPHKPIPAGLVSRAAVIRAAALAAGLGLALTATLPFGSWLIGLAGLACGLAYDVGLKRTVLSWLPLSLAIPLVPAWAYTAVGAWEPLLWWGFPIGALLGLSVHLANQLPDIPSDRRRAVRGLAQRSGPTLAYAGSLSAFGAGASIAAVVLAVTAHAMPAAAVGITAFFVIGLAPRSVRFFGPSGLFGLMAVSSALCGLAFLSAV